MDYILTVIIGWGGGYCYQTIECPPVVRGVYKTQAECDTVESEWLQRAESYRDRQPPSVRKAIWILASCHKGTPGQIEVTTSTP